MTSEEIQKMRNVLEEAAAMRAEHGAEEQGIDIIARLSPGDPPLFEGYLCMMPTLVDMLDICERSIAKD